MTASKAFEIMGSKAIVTLADSNYFELLLELIDSIKNCNESKVYLYVFWMPV